MRQCQRAACIGTRSVSLVFVSRGNAEKTLPRDRTEGRPKSCGARSYDRIAPLQPWQVPNAPGIVEETMLSYAYCRGDVRIVTMLVTVELTTRQI